MKICQLQQQTGRTLYLILNGWSASPELFNQLPLPEGADVWVAYDYRDLTFPESLAGFEEVHLIAWSLGVWVATTLWGSTEPFTSTTAINGTPFPIHDTWGIPPAIFEGTLQHLDADGFRRFDRRMCGDRNTWQRYQQLPSRPDVEKATELQALYQAIQSTPMDPIKAARFWNRAIISQSDLIVPTAHQQAYWHGKATIESLEAPHLPFFQPALQTGLWK
ncbi:MAG: DUF452 family protein [Parabacteroides sp.]|nr:DUF452 family protein [Parabacteroides sp.]